MRARGAAWTTRPRYVRRPRPEEARSRTAARTARPSPVTAARAVATTIRGCTVPATGNATCPSTTYSLAETAAKKNICARTEANSNALAARKGALISRPPIAAGRSPEAKKLSRAATGGHSNAPAARAIATTSLPPCAAAAGPQRARMAPSLSVSAAASRPWSLCCPRRGLVCPRCGLSTANRLTTLRGTPGRSALSAVVQDYRDANSSKTKFEEKTVETVEIAMERSARDFDESSKSRAEIVEDHSPCHALWKSTTVCAEGRPLVVWVFRSAGDDVTQGAATALCQILFSMGELVMFDRSFRLLCCVLTHCKRKT